MGMGRKGTGRRGVRRRGLTLVLLLLLGAGVGARETAARPTPGGPLLILGSGYHGNGHMLDFELMADGPTVYGLARAGRSPWDRVPLRISGIVRRGQLRARFLDRDNREVGVIEGDFRNEYRGPYSIGGEPGTWELHSRALPDRSRTAGFAGRYEVVNGRDPTTRVLLRLDARLGQVDVQAVRNGRRVSSSRGKWTMDDEGRLWMVFLTGADGPAEGISPILRPGKGVLVFQWPGYTPDGYVVLEGDSRGGDIRQFVLLRRL